MVKQFGHWITVECLVVVPVVVVAKMKCHRYCIMYITKILLRSTVFAGYTETMGKKLSRSDLDYKPI